MERLTKVMDKYLSEAKKKVLTLAVSKEWFDMIVSGEKNEEYREIKPYWASRLVNQQAESGEVLFDEFGGYCRVIGELDTNHTPTFSLLTATARIANELRRILRVLPSASRRKVFAQASGWIMNFSSSSSSNMDKTTELSYNHLISQLRKENADLRNEVRELRKLLTRKSDKPPN